MLLLRFRALPAMNTSSGQVSPEYFRFRQRLVLGLLLIACMVILAVSWKISSSLRERERAARIQTQAYSY